MNLKSNFPHGVDLKGNKIENIGTPTSDQDASPKLYVDNEVASLIDDASTGTDKTLSAAESISRLADKADSVHDHNAAYYQKSETYNQTEIDNAIGIAISNLDWKESVATFADLATTYPTPQEGWTVSVDDTNIIYRYDAGVPEWVGISANSIPNATPSQSGNMSAADKTKLDAIEANANNYSLPIAAAGTLGGVLSGTDITIDGSGNVSVNDDSHQHQLDNLSNVAIASLATNDILGWNGSNWINRTLAAAGIASASHNHSLDSLQNVTIDTNTDGELLRWNGSIWINNTLTEAGILGLVGGAVTGFITLHADPTDNLHAATKQYADGKLALAGGSITGNIDIDAQIWSVLHAQTHSATLAFDMDNGNVQEVTLADNTAFSDPTNLRAGARYTFIIKQDATGSRTGSFGTAWKFPGGTAPTLTTTADAVDIIEAVSDGTNLYAQFSAAYS